MSAALAGELAALCERHGLMREVVREVPRVGPMPVIPEGGIDLWRAVKRYEADLIRQAFERTGGNKARAARLLGLQRTTLVEKIKVLEWQAQ